MDASGASAGSPTPPVTYWTPPPPSKYPRGARLAVGSVVTFIVASILFGPGNVTQALLFATICTLGIGLVAILFCCWLVGWVVLEVWSALRPPGRSPSTP